jgi:hypothetical protein
MVADNAQIEFSYRRLFGGRYGALLASLLLLLIFSPFLTEQTTRSGVLDVLLSAVMLTGIYAAGRLRKSFTVGLGLVVPTLATHWGVHFFPYRAGIALHYTLMILLLLYTMTIILSAIISDVRVTLETIKGAVCVYLLLGLIWVFVFGLIDLSDPGSFRITPGPDSRKTGFLLIREMFPQVAYYSFSTLTTLGYGDIVARSAPAQTFSYLEAIAGQIFLTVLVARLVGMHISNPSRDDSARP